MRHIDPPMATGSGVRKGTGLRAIGGLRHSSGTIGAMTVELRPWTLEDAPALCEANRQSPDLEAAVRC